MIVVVQIGNSDDKLTQKRWSMFVSLVDTIVDKVSAEIYFSGGSPTNMEWQNYCWVFEMFELDFDQLKATLNNARKLYDQDSIAVITGEIGFV